MTYELRTISDYAEAVSRKEISDYEQAVRDGRIVLVTCPVCQARVTKEMLPPEDHLCLFGETWQ